MGAPFREAPGVRLTHWICSAGGTGVSRARFVSVLLRADLLVEREAQHVAVEGIALLDASGAVLTATEGPVELRVVPPDARPYDLSPEHTAPLAGGVGPGAAVRLLAGGELAPYDGDEAVSYRALFVIDGARVALEGPLGPSWATAGPARV